MRRLVKRLSQHGLAVMVVAAGAQAALAAEPLSVFTLMSPDGGVGVRAILEGSSPCPVLDVDSRPLPMRVRAAPATLPLRPTASAPDLAKPSRFPVTVCEADLKRGVRRAFLDGRRLALPPALIRRILVIGDTGCRVKASDKAAQACNDPAAYPFAALAKAAAAFAPDLVVHVGDYLYRENPCPDGVAGCAGSPWGYGWDAWRADFFDPAAPLLAAAPLALARGNHETCNRAGQGWRRLLDAGPLRPGQDCVDPENDAAGDHTAPYAVALGGGDQLIMMDTAAAPNKALSPEDPKAALFAGDWDAMAVLAARRPRSFMVNHQPILAFAAVKGSDGLPALRPGNLALQSVYQRKSPDLVPPGVQTLLSGHVHVWEALSFKGDLPSQFVTGFSGTQEDIVPLPETLGPTDAPAPGAAPAAFSSWVDGFGFMTLERRGRGSWSVQVRNVAGAVVNTCAIKGRRTTCALRQVKTAASS